MKKTLEGYMLISNIRFSDGLVGVRLTGITDKGGFSLDFHFSDYMRFVKSVLLVGAHAVAAEIKHLLASTK